MNKSTKAVLLSALVFPGAGHLYLKQYAVGFILLGSALTAIYIAVSAIIESAMQIVDQIESGNVTPDIATITGLVSGSAADTSSQPINLATFMLLIIWLFGIVDAYRKGSCLDRENKAKKF